MEIDVEDLARRLVVGRKRDGRGIYDPGAKRELVELCQHPGISVARLASDVGVNAKSTSLKSFIETLPGLEHKAIYTVEDSIEYEIAGAHQIEVLRDIAKGDETRRRYAEVMRALMRSDPDGVMLGEIRDKLTALFALQIAETGHLALGTVHAHLISNIIPRLTNDQIGVSRQALTGPNILKAPPCGFSAIPARSNRGVSCGEFLPH